MKIAVHLREGENRTNIRSESLVAGLEAAGHTVHRYSRGTGVRGYDLVVQTGFAGSAALMAAIDTRTPYLIMEASPFRTLTDMDTNSSWGYNGLAGGAFRHSAPNVERPKPALEQMKAEGGVLIIGQKPTDHSMRGSDHVQWLTEKFREYPDAKFRPHPLCYTGTLPPLEDALDEAQKVIVYTSTTAVEAACKGCEVIVEGPGCWWDATQDREEQLHELSWATFKHSEYHRASTAEWILEGWEEAKAWAEAGQVEIPRGRVDGQAVSEYYNREVLRRHP